MKPLKLEAKKSPRKITRKAIVKGENSGIAAETITNNGTMAGIINVEKLPKGPIHVFGSLVTSVDHYGYMEHLIKRLARYQSWPKRKGGPPDNPGAVRKNFKDFYGRLPKDFPLDRFKEAVNYFVEKMNKTALGKAGKARVSTFEEWKQKGRPKS